MSSPPEHSLATGRIVRGKYRLGPTIGAGGMGHVVAATHVQLQTKLALKFLRPEHAEDPESKARFLQEARIVTQLSSEHVIRVLDVDTDEMGIPFIAMEMLDGLDLGTYLERHGPMQIAETVQVLRQVASGLSEAHMKGIVHRDLKPANLFLVRRWSGEPLVKILDFGISKALPQSSIVKASELTRSEVYLGSPHYMAPEQLMSSSTVDIRADLWSLGVTAFRLLTGKLPFGAGTQWEIASHVLSHPIPSVRKLRPEIPIWLDAVIKRCMNRDLSARFQNVGEFLAAIDAGTTSSAILGTLTPTLDASLSDTAETPVNSVSNPPREEAEKGTTQGTVTDLTPPSRTVRRAVTAGSFVGLLLGSFLAARYFLHSESAADSQRDLAAIQPANPQPERRAPEAGMPAEPAIVEAREVLVQGAPIQDAPKTTDTPVQDVRSRTRETSRSPRTPASANAAASPLAAASQHPGTPKQVETPKQKPHVSAKPSVSDLPDTR